MERLGEVGMMMMMIGEECAVLSGRKGVEWSGVEWSGVMVGGWGYKDDMCVWRAE